jgi:hypothetical protein
VIDVDPGNDQLKQRRIWTDENNETSEEMTVWSVNLSKFRTFLNLLPASTLSLVIDRGSTFSQINKSRAGEGRKY